MSLAPGAIVTSPVRVCTPAHVSVPVIVPEVVSLEAETVPAGKARESRMLNRNNPVREKDRIFLSRAIVLRTTTGQYNHTLRRRHFASGESVVSVPIPNSF